MLVVVVLMVIVFVLAVVVVVWVVMLLIVVGGGGGISGGVDSYSSSSGFSSGSGSFGGGGDISVVGGVSRDAVVEGYIQYIGSGVVLVLVSVDGLVEAETNQNAYIHPAPMYCTRTGKTNIV